MRQVVRAHGVLADHHIGEQGVLDRLPEDAVGDALAQLRRRRLRGHEGLLERRRTAHLGGEVGDALVHGGRVGGDAEAHSLLPHKLAVDGLLERPGSGLAQQAPFGEHDADRAGAQVMPVDDAGDPVGRRRCRGGGRAAAGRKKERERRAAREDEHRQSKSRGADHGARPGEPKTDERVSPVLAAARL